MKDEIKWEVSFDGKGLNDALSPYLYRLATLTTVADGTSFGEFAERAINNHNELVTALEIAVEQGEFETRVLEILGKALAKVRP